MHVFSPVTARRAVVGASVAALSASMLALAGPATAADGPVVQVRGADIAPNAEPYAGWHQGANNGVHAVTAEGLELTGASQVINGYDDNDNNLDTQNADLATVLPEVEYTVASGKIWLQVPIFFANETTTTTRFTTLRPYEAGDEGVNDVELSDTWIATSKISDEILANTPYSLDAILADLGDHKTIAFGVYSDRSSNGTVKDLTWAGTKYVFSDAPRQLAKVEVSEREIAANADQYAGWHQGYADAAQNHRVTTAGGLELTGPSQIIKGYEDNTNDVNAKNVDLRMALGSAAYTVTEGNAWFQVPVFFKADVSADATTFATLRPAEPAGVGTHTINLADQWVASKAVGDVPASQPTPLRELLGEMKAYKVLAFGVLTDRERSAKVADITWDDTTYSFVNHAPVLAARQVTTKVGVPVSVKLGATDGDDNALSVATSTAGASISGDTLTVAVPRTVRANRSVTVTADDGRGAVTTATITIRVVRADASVVLASPQRIKAGKRMKTKVRVTSTAAVKNAVVDIYVAGRKVGTGKVNAAGRATITTKKLTFAKGDRKVFAKVRTNALLKAERSNVRDLRIR